MMSSMYTKERTTPPLHGQRKPPGPGGLRLLGRAREIQHAPLQFFTELTRTYGDIAFVRLLVWPVYVVNHPDFVLPGFTH